MNINLKIPEKEYGPFISKIEDFRKMREFEYFRNKPSEKLAKTELEVYYLLLRDKFTKKKESFKSLTNMYKYLSKNYLKKERRQEKGIRHIKSLDKKKYMGKGGVFTLLREAGVMEGEYHQRNVRVRLPPIDDKETKALIEQQANQFYGILDEETAKRPDWEEKEFLEALRTFLYEDKLEFRNLREEYQKKFEKPENRTVHDQMILRAIIDEGPSFKAVEKESVFRERTQGTNSEELSLIWPENTNIEVQPQNTKKSETNKKDKDKIEKDLFEEPFNLGKNLNAKI